MSKLFSIFILISLLSLSVSLKTCDRFSNLIIDSDQWFGDFSIEFNNINENVLKFDLIFEPRMRDYVINSSHLIDIGTDDTVNLDIIGNFDNADLEIFGFNLEDIIFDGSSLCSEAKLFENCTKNDDSTTEQVHNNFAVIMTTSEATTSTTMNKYTETTPSMLSIPPANNKLECGIVVTQIQPLIFHGVPASQAQFPWHAAIYYYSTQQLSYICGGSLISDTFVITAAHCATQSATDVALNGDRLVLFFGKDFLHQFNKHEQNSRVSQVFISSDYDPRRYKSDLALLQLKTPPQITNFVSPVCLWNFSTNLEAIVGETGMVNLF